MTSCMVSDVCGGNIFLFVGDKAKPCHFSEKNRISTSKINAFTMSGGLISTLSKTLVGVEVAGVEFMLVDSRVADVSDTRTV